MSAMPCPPSPFTPARAALAAAAFGAFVLAAAACAPAAPPATAADAEAPAICGPQSPRDISVAGGTNRLRVPGDGTRPPRLCNVHFHRPGEHTGIGACPAAGGGTGAGVCGGRGTAPVRPGQEIETHWVYTSCPAPTEPRPGLENCVCDAPPELVLMVFGQKYVVAAEGAAGADRELREPSTGLARYGGSTTGPSFSDGSPDDDLPCSPARVQWRVSQECRALDVAALGDWCESNEWDEDYAHGIRGVIEREDWLSPYVPPGS